MEVDAFLADSVVNADGKLYAQGAGWNILFAQDMPVRHNRIGLGIVVTVPYTATNNQHSLEVTLEGEDGEKLPLADAAPGVESEDGKVRTLGAQFNIGRPPTVPAGDEQIVAFAINIDGMVFEKAARYTFVISIDGTPMRRLPFRVSLIQQQQVIAR